MDHGRDDNAQRYAYDSLVEGDVFFDEALDVLRASRKDGKPHVPTFAQNMLERLSESGLLHRTDTEPPVNVRKARMDKRQRVWLRYDTRRDKRQGYMAVDVVDAPRSDRAILAAMVAWLGRRVDFEQLLDGVRLVLSGHYTVEMKKAATALIKVKDRAIAEPLLGYMLFLHVEMASPLLRAMGRQEESKEVLDIIFGEPGSNEDSTSEEGTQDDWAMVGAASEFLPAIEALLQPLLQAEYLFPLIRYAIPEFDNYSADEQSRVIEKACAYTNNYLKDLDQLQAFLEYGTPDRRPIPAVKEPRREVRAAVLHDVDGLSYRQIGEMMEIPLPPDFEIKGEHQAVRKMVERGRRILISAFGEKGWREHVAKMKAEKSWWQSLTQEERQERIEAEYHALQLESLSKRPAD